MAQGLREIGIHLVDPITLHMDAKSAIALAKNPMHHKRSKHIDIKYHWLREHTYEDGTIHLEHCVTEDMVEDLMTKALAFDLHSQHAKNITGNGNVVQEVSGGLAALRVRRHRVL